MGAALLLDAVLHLADAVWIGRWLGIPGVLLILGSFGHSLRKRKIIRRGNPVKYLRLHERMGWAGSLLVLVHAGIHFNAVLAWLALAAMLINVTSGLTGKYLLQRAQRWLREARTQMREAGAQSEEIELRLHWDSPVFDWVKQWRKAPAHRARLRGPGCVPHRRRPPVLELAMTRRWLWAAIGLFLVAVIAAAFFWPHQMVSPGNLRPTHAALESDCFACHVPFRGVSSDRCIACHKVADIGKRTTTGLPMKRERPIPPFHQALTEKNCLACHSDHPAPRLTEESPKAFDHALLTPPVRGQCQACHRAPQDAQHQGLNLPCAQCHQPANWKPATFDHSRYFLLDGDHRVACVTCHTGQNFRRYTCTGCHEHEQARIKAEHEEKGIRNIDNCVRCHRSARGEPDEGDGRKDRRKGEDD